MDKPAIPSLLKHRDDRPPASVQNILLAIVRLHFHTVRYDSCLYTIGFNPEIQLLLWKGYHECLCSDHNGKKSPVLLPPRSLTRTPHDLSESLAETLCFSTAFGRKILYMKHYIFLTHKIVDAFLCHYSIEHFENMLGGVKTFRVSDGEQKNHLKCTRVIHC